jgi:hypothetical protein
MHLNAFLVLSLLQSAILFTCCYFARLASHHVHTPDSMYVGRGVISRYDAVYCALMQCKMRRGLAYTSIDSD